MLLQPYCGDMPLRQTPVRHCAPQLVSNASSMLAISILRNFWLTPPASTLKTSLFPRILEVWPLREKRPSFDFQSPTQVVKESRVPLEFYNAMVAHLVPASCD